MSDANLQLLLELAIVVALLAGAGALGLWRSR